MRVGLTIFLLTTSVLNGLTQTIGDNWFFGNGAGLRFGNEFVVPRYDGRPANPGTFSISTQDGELVCYGSRDSVFTRNHTIMPNGNIFVNFQAAEAFGPQIIPYPSTQDSFLLFYHIRPDSFLATHHIYYSHIDMSLNGGLGNIIPGQKHIDLIDDVGRHFEYVERCDGDGYWLITRNAVNGEILVFTLTSEGLDTIPQVFPGAVNTPLEFYTYDGGEVEVSPDGTKLAFAHRGDARIEFMEFNRSSGAVSNPFLVNMVNSNRHPYTMEFSPSGEFLYVGTYDSPFTIGHLLQFEMSTFSSSSIASSVDSISASSNGIWEIQTGPDFKLYIASGYDTTLHVVNRPDLAGQACELELNAIDLNGYYSYNYLPDFTFRQLLNPIGERVICIGDTAFFSYEDSCLLNLEWDFDDPNGTSGSLTAMNTFHVFSDTGIFDVMLDIEYSAASKQFENQIRVVPNDLPDVFPDTMTVCDSTLSVDISLVDYLWSIGAESSEIHIDSSGWYSVTLSNPCDTTIDSVYAILKQPLSPFTIPDTSLCQGDTLLFHPIFNIEADYNWSTGETSSSLEISSNLSPDLSPIILWLEASNACNTVSDTATISFLPQPDIGWYSDSVLCDQNAAVVPQPIQQGVDHFMTYTTDDVLNDTLPKPWRIDTHGLYYLHAFNVCDTLVKRAFLSPQQVIALSLGEDTVLCSGDSVVLDAAWPGSTYQWNSTVSVDHQADSSVVAYADDIEGEVSYIVTITNPPCQRIASKDISVLPSGCDTFACKFSIPNVFSPNADGINDVLSIENNCDDLRYSISIYNRWGQLGFAEQHSSSSSVHWDGSINGEPASEGTYYLIIEHGEGRVQRAAITLVR